MSEYKRLLEGNLIWQKTKLAADPEFFSRLEGQQSPDFLWIGCSDSRVSANEITNTDPGEIFVHRNIANQVIPGDPNMTAVLDFAVNQLRVKHVIVCGHYGCGGIMAADSALDYGPVLNHWLKPMKAEIDEFKEELEGIEKLEDRRDRLTEINVLVQVKRLAQIPAVQRAWAERNGPILHGWVYRLKDGLLNPLLELRPGSQPEFHDF